MLRGKKTKTLVILATALLLLTVYAAAMEKVMPAPTPSQKIETTQMRHSMSI